MTPFTIVPVANVNLRTGPGISYEIEDKLYSGENIQALESKKDGGGTTWYKTDRGWVNSLYVKQPNQMQQNPKSRIAAPRAGNIENMVSDIVQNISVDSGVIKDIANIGMVAAGVQAQEDNQNAILARRIYGTPFQFLNATDMRPNQYSALGTQFVGNILCETPILSLIPGIPDYLADMSNDEKREITTGLFSKLESAVQYMQEKAGQALDDKKLDTRFFEFTSRTSEYMLYVNLLCRMCAIFIGLGDDKYVPGTNTKYSEYNWFNWHLSNAYANRSIEVGGVPEAYDIMTGKVKRKSNGQFEGELDHNSVRDELKTQSEGYSKIDADMKKSMNKITDGTNNAYFLDQYYMDFFIKPPSYSESFSNSTDQSSFANQLSGYSQIQREFAFAFGSMYKDIGVIKDNIENYEKVMHNYINDTFTNNAGMRKAMSRLVSGSTSIITGSNLVFPEIWSSSSYNRDFQIEITLSTPYADKESIYLEILVPMMHLLAFVLPRQTSVNSYTAPFIVRANVPGFFSCDMGIVRDMQINKGGSSGDCWSVDGLPTEVNISLGIQDLYNALSMSNVNTVKNAWNFIYNTPLLDFIGIQCGLNMKSSEFQKKIDLIECLWDNALKSQVDYTVMTMQEELARNRAKFLAMGNK